MIFHEYLHLLVCFTMLVVCLLEWIGQNVSFEIVVENEGCMR